MCALPLRWHGSWTAPTLHSSFRFSNFWVTRIVNLRLFITCFWLCSLPATMCVNCIYSIFWFLTHVCIPDFNDSFLLTLSAQEYPSSHWFDSTETPIAMKPSFLLNCLRLKGCLLEPFFISSFHGMSRSWIQAFCSRCQFRACWEDWLKQFRWAFGTWRKQHTASPYVEIQKY